MFKLFKKSTNQQGSILLAIILMLPFLILITASYMELSVQSITVARRGQLQTHAQLAADAGVDQAMQDINQSETFAGSDGEVELQASTNNVRTTYETAVSEVDDTHKTLTSVGRAYQGSSSVPTSSITVEVALRGVSTGQYSVVSGVGGMIMRNSASIVNGSVYVNGTLNMSNTSRIGLSILPVDVKVAHQSCPTGSNPGATYPQVCGPGNGQPITMNNSAHIYGDVEATNQQDGSGMSNGGLIPNSSPPAVSLPDYNRTAHKNAVTTEMNGSNADCGLLPFKTWPADLKINGNVTIDGACIVTLEGNVWITGNLTIRNSGILIVKNGLSEPPVIMVDGSSGLNMRNAATFLPNLGLVGTRVITFANATGNPDATPTGTDLYNSQNMTTIDINNIASGVQTEFYARWSKVVAGNSGSVGAIAGQTVELTNSIAITLGTSVSGFSETVWVIDSVKREF